MKNDIAISVQNLSKSYKMYRSPTDRIKEFLHPGKKSFHRAFWALREISFDIEKGATFGIIGQNGSGKSTLLQLISGIIRPTNGSVTVNGRISALLELGAGFHRDFSGRENVFMQGALMGISREEMEKNFQSIEEFADIGNFIDQPVKTYSSGMYVRLAFATAVNVDPDILIIDEVLAVGDDMFKRRCFRKIEEFQEQGKTILFVSHSLTNITSICNMSLLLDKGNLLQIGIPKDIVNSYSKLVSEREEQYFTRLSNKINSHSNGKSQATKVSEFRYGAGGATLSNIEILNEKSDIVHTVESGNKYKIRITAKAENDMENPALGFMIKTLNGVEIYGTSTHLKNQQIGPVKAGTHIEVEFEQSMLFNPGSYTLTSAIAENTEFGRVFHDRRMDAVVFKVIGKPTASGLVDLKSSLKIDVITSDSTISQVADSRDDKPLIIVLGNQKSGTTAIASLLADYGGLTKTLDIPEIWEKESEILSGKLSFDSFIKCNQDRFKSELIKEPCLTFMYDQLTEVFPDSKYIFVIRHPADNIRSILDRLNIPGNLDHVDIDSATHKSWKYLFDGSLLNIKDEHYISRLATRWVLTATQYIEHRNNTHLLKYEDFIDDKYKSIQQLASKLEINQANDINHLLNQQYQPKGKNNGVPWIDFFGEKNLDLIKTICKEYMQCFDYQISDK